jgi:hypothetical protein
MEMEKILLGKYGPLLTLSQLAELLDRSPEGLRISLNSNTPLSRFLKPKRLKIGRRVYFRSNHIAELLDGQLPMEQ